jgi:hypothetical protein
MKNFACAYFNHFEGKLRLEKISAPDELEASKKFIFGITTEEDSEYREEVKSFISFFDLKEYLRSCDIDFSVIS